MKESAHADSFFKKTYYNRSTGKPTALPSLWTVKACSSKTAAIPAICPLSRRTPLHSRNCFISFLNVFNGSDKSPHIFLPATVEPLCLLAGREPFFSPPFSLFEYIPPIKKVFPVTARTEPMSLSATHIFIKRMSGIHLAVPVFSKGYRPKQGKVAP